MLRDDMSLQKKEMQSARADIGDAVAVTANIDSRFHMLESQMQSLLKKITEDQAAHDKAAADKSSPVMPVSDPADPCPYMHVAMMSSGAAACDSSRNQYDCYVYSFQLSSTHFVRHDPIV